MICSAERQESKKAETKTAKDGSNKRKKDHDKLPKNLPLTEKKAKEVGEGEEVGDTSENTVSEASRVEGQSKSRRLKRTGNLDKAGLSQNTNKRGKDAPTEKLVTVEVENPHGAPEPDVVL